MSSTEEEHLQLAIEAAQLGTWTWEMATGVTVWDAQLEILHGMEPGEFGGTFEDWVDLLHADDRTECLLRLQRALSRRERYMLLHRTVWRDGSVHWIECRGRVLVDEHGEPTGTVGVAQDVTAREARRADILRRLESEHRLVGALQRALLPIALPTVHGVSIAARYQAAGTGDIGGDWYALLPLPEDRLGIAIGDVAGHGLTAVADMAGARFSLRALALTENDPTTVLEKLDRVVQVFEGDTMITALYGIVDPEAGTFAWSNAGHLPPAVRYPDGRVELLETPPDPPLGTGSPFEHHQMAIPYGSTIVLFTDGLIERRREPLQDGLDRLVDVCALGPADPEDLADALVDKLAENAVDDVALVVVRVDAPT